MKSTTTLLKTIVLSIGLLIIATGAQAANAITGITSIVITSGGPLTYGTGGTITYTITFSCDGGNPGSNVTMNLSYPLPTGVTSNIASNGKTVNLGNKANSATTKFTLSSTNTCHVNLATQVTYSSGF